ncbi:hypothetical protein TVAG_449800 [Trichomonas vaginalis G3]|uniref:Uncharacterized protein n=1 Tax=Trichomonas vaginalis (strain ATCC PRA-98 / G3) TaxID=412133 RepID=A2F4C4_TRIV3|nr:hypothetical protein TVAGG3_0431770 [Trichomonas vaginalis G3]EAY00244.1 hypothetical protein TVAG_449800 [Trichomonas vaginalis G3]KAI5536799.1 hypothetical protein TVAGG3_0431770 [Trichomonas vaginalis G3]|eukprot:XP_001313173.1 hypothetical protein [Trichomonas vaginalis G3]
MTNVTKSEISQQSASTERYYSFFKADIDQPKVRVFKNDDNSNIRIEQPKRSKINLEIPEEQVVIPSNFNGFPTEINEYDSDHVSEENEVPLVMETQDAAEADLIPMADSENMKSSVEFSETKEEIKFTSLPLRDSDQYRYSFAIDSETHIVICDISTKTTFSTGENDPVHETLSTANVGQNVCYLCSNSTGNSLTFPDGQKHSTLIQNPFSIMTDPRNPNVLFVLDMENTLFATNFKKTVKLHQGVQSFDVSKTYIMLKRQNTIQIYLRNDFSLEILVFEIPAENDHFYGVNNKYLVDYYGNTVSLIYIENKTKEKEFSEIKAITKTTDFVFLSEHAIHTIDYTIPLETAADAVFLHKENSFVILRFSDGKPDIYEYSLTDEYKKQIENHRDTLLKKINLISEEDRSKMKELIANVVSINNKYLNYHAQLLKSIQSPEALIEIYKKDPVSAFTYSIGLPPLFFLRLASDGRLSAVLGQDLINSDLSSRLIPNFTYCLTYGDRNTFVPLIYKAILLINPCDKQNCKKFLPNFLEVILDIYKQASQSSPYFKTLRLLSHVAMSLDY